MELFLHLHVVVKCAFVGQFNELVLERAGLYCRIQTHFPLLIKIDRIFIWLIKSNFYVVSWCLYSLNFNFHRISYLCVCVCVCVCVCIRVCEE